MRILLVAPYGGVQGGIARWTGHIIKYYTKKGFVDCKLDLIDMGRSTFVNINSPLWYRISSAIKDYNSILKNYKNQLISNHYDIVHLTSNANISLLKDLYILRLAKRFNAKTIVHFHFGRIPQLKTQNNWEWKLLCRVVRKADRVVVIDSISYKALRDCGFTNVEFLPNPVSPQVVDIVEKNKDIVRENRTLLFVGHVVKTKGVIELVEACKGIDNIKLRIVGTVTDEMRSELLALTDNAKWMEIVGEKPYAEVIKEMLRCDLFVLPTYTEGFPNVILESMACGCAIVTTPVGAIPEMLEEKNGQQYGVLVEPQKVEPLRTAIIEILDNDALKHECRNNVQKRVIERYNMNAVWSMLVKIWENVK